MLIEEFNVWQPGYGGATVSIYVAGTTSLALVYTDEALTQGAGNPQTLSSLSSNGIVYGKFAAPLYVGDSYFLSIDETSEDTGVQRQPLVTLDDEDASEATVLVEGSATPNTLKSITSRICHAENFGEIETGLTGTAATNTTTLLAAIGSLTNGGTVILPVGLILLNPFSHPGNVIIKGQGQAATTIQCTAADKISTLTGDNAGFEDITIDGNALTSGSIGIYGVGTISPIMRNVTVKRFDKGVYFKGCKRPDFENFNINNCNYGALFYGDTDAGDTVLGTAFENAVWKCGLVDQCVQKAVSLSYEDAQCQNIRFVGVSFEDNGTAVDINGAQFIQFASCSFSGNTTNMAIQDDTDPLTPSTTNNNKVISLTIDGGRLHEGAFTVTGTAQDIILSNVEIEDVDFTLSTPINNCIVFKNCLEDSAVTFSGEASKIQRKWEGDGGSVTGLTTGAAAVKAWGLELKSGQVVCIEAKAVAKSRNTTDRSVYHVSIQAYRTAATLNFDTQTANFTLGDVLTGASSAATARIVAQTDSGTTGSLSLTDVVGTFLDNETITDGAGGSALVNGTITEGTVTVNATTSLAAYETDAGYAIAGVASGSEVEIQVTGNTSETVEWTVNVDVVSS